VRKLIEDAAARFIAGQLHDAAEKLRDYGIASAAMIFKPRDWDDRLRKAVGPPIARAMMLGAATELGLRLNRSKSTASDYLERLGIEVDDFATEFPPELVTAIESALADSFQREYWQHVNGTTRNHIETLVRNGTTEGLSIRDMASQIENAGQYSRSRATAIARTESTRALNSGHTLGIEQTENETGVLLGKQWVSVAGATSREEHIAADGQTVPTDQQFNLGGYLCDYPGDASLPAEHAINCLCSVISGDLDL
jgi:hypothetical protein